MEYCDSGDMRGILKKPIKEKYAQFYFSQLANGLRYLYNNNIVHRDIKPRNILLTSNRRVLKIADFGFARQVAQENHMYQTVCGSPLYMAPEIIKKSDYNNQTDLWSLGMILFEILYGFHPFHNCKSIPELKSVISNEEIIIPPVDTRNEVSEECLDFLRKLLQKDVLHRFTWEQFFDHPWVRSLEDDKKNYKNILCASSIGSIAPPKHQEEPLDFEVIVINDYVESVIEVDDEHQDMFEMELDKKSFVHKSSVLNSNSNVYDMME
jgi:serine/threonine-protein kinase ULK/ATG1